MKNCRLDTPDSLLSIFPVPYPCHFIPLSFPKISRIPILFWPNIPHPGIGMRDMGPCMCLNSLRIFTFHELQLKYIWVKDQFSYVVVVVLVVVVSFPHLTSGTFAQDAFRRIRDLQNGSLDDVIRIHEELCTVVFSTVSAYSVWFVLHWFTYGAAVLLFALSLPWVPEVCLARFPVSVNVSILTRAKNLWRRAPFL